MAPAVTLVLGKAMVRPPFSRNQLMTDLTTTMKLNHLSI